MDYLDYATTATGIPITECDTCGQRHPVTRAHCSRCRSWSAFQRSGLCLICSEIVAAHGVSRRPEGAEMGETWQNGGEHETAPTGELVPHQPGPDRDSTPLTEGGIVAETTVPEADPNRLIHAQCACCGTRLTKKASDRNRMHFECWEEHHSDPGGPWPPGHQCRIPRSGY